MPVPTLVTDLSTTLASNSPAGSDNVFPDLDNYLRALSGFVASIRDNSGNGWVSPYLPLTYSAGTANGVVYLNGSKVVTTGSALVFDGTNFSTTGTASATKLIPTGGSATGNGMFLPAANTLGFSTNGAETMRLDASGNLGLGVTPSAWQVDWNVYQASRDAAFGGVDGGAVYGFMSVNAYADGSASPSTATWRYQLTGSLASKYEQTSGEHRWFTAPSGTAGNAISFTQAMTLDASGQLSVGAVLAENSTGVYLLPTGEMRVKDNTENGTSQISIYNTNTTNDSEQFFVAMNVADVDIGNKRTDGGALKLFTNNTERARITNGGDLLVGTTTTPSSSNAGFVVAKDADGTYLRNACTITTTRTHFEFVNGNGTVGTISTNASATAYNTSSDRRLKEGIAPAADAGPIIDAIEVVQHDWKVGGHTRFGVIAQDLNAVAPEAVSAGDDGEEIEKTWGVDYSKLVPMLIKEIQSLRARVAALEQA